MLLHGRRAQDTSGAQPGESDNRLRGPFPRVVQEVSDDRYGASVSGNPILTTTYRSQVRRLDMGEEGFWMIFCQVWHADSEGQCAFFTRGSLTFREAYLRTGRILNISVIPADRHSYVPAPDHLSRITPEQPPQADQALELYDCPRLHYLECTSCFCRRAGYPQLGCHAAEDEGWDGHSVELGE